MACKYCILIILAVALSLVVNAGRPPKGLPKPRIQLKKPNRLQSQQIATECVKLAKKGYSPSSTPHKDLEDCHEPWEKNDMLDDLPNYLASMKRCTESSAYYKLERCVNARIAALG